MMNKYMYQRILSSKMGQSLSTEAGQIYFLIRKEFSGKV